MAPSQENRGGEGAAHKKKTIEKKGRAKAATANANGAGKQSKITRGAGSAADNYEEDSGKDKDDDDEEDEEDEDEDLNEDFVFDLLFRFYRFASGLRLQEKKGPACSAQRLTRKACAP